MISENPASPGVAVQALITVITMLGMFAIAFGIKLATKARAYGTARWGEAKFDLFRMGSDLCLLGFSAYFSAYKLAPADIAAGLRDWNEPVVVTQVVLLLGTVLPMIFFDSPADGLTFRAVWGPLLVGGLSLVISAIVFVHVLLRS